jgi:F-type H+-transporting ATPase subunit gamma
MASLRDIRKRIRSVKNIRQITKAMKMVAASRLRKAQEAVVAARPYAKMLDGMVADLATRSEGELQHPLLVARPVKRAELVVLTSHRGLAGGFNANVIRRVSRILFERDGVEHVLTTSGRRGHDFFKNRGHQIRQDYPDLVTSPSFEGAKALANQLTARYLAGEVDSVSLVYNEFLSAISQEVVEVQLLPLTGLVPSEDTGTAGANEVDFKYEPDPQAVLDGLIPQAVALKVLRALLESAASEHGARMSAMENATKNAGELIDDLTLTYNRTRQAVITNELSEIVSGAEALD